MSEPEHSVDDWLHDAAQRMRDEKEQGAAPRAEKLTVREFLAKFDYARRGYRVVREIRHRLEKHHLRTTPDFQFHNIHSSISIELDDNLEAEDDEAESVSPTVRVDSLAAAHNPPVQVAPNDTVLRAITLMRIRGFSQLPVMTTITQVKGVISWRSIGKAYVDGCSPRNVQDCMEEPHEVATSASLTDATREIWKHDYILVRGKDRKITGIVTAADLALQFEELALPFLLIGEIEQHLRNLVRGKFTVEEFAQAARGEKEIRGPIDLTFGDYCRLLGHEESWKKLDVNIDRKEFIKHLEEVRIIRNDVMHFSPDGIEPEHVEQLDQLVSFLRDLVHSQENKVKSAGN